MTCDIVPGSLGGVGSVPWCRTHNRYAAACEAVAQERARIAEAVRGLPHQLAPFSLGHPLGPSTDALSLAAVLAIVEEP